MCSLHDKESGGARNDSDRRAADERFLTRVLDSCNRPTDFLMWLGRDECALRAQYYYDAVALCAIRGWLFECH